MRCVWDKDWTEEYKKIITVALLKGNNSAISTFGTLGFMSLPSPSIGKLLLGSSAPTFLQLETLPSPPPPPQLLSLK